MKELEKAETSSFSSALVGHRADVPKVHMENPVQTADMKNNMKKFGIKYTVVHIKVQLVHSQAQLTTLVHSLVYQVMLKHL